MIANLSLNELMEIVVLIDDGDEDSNESNRIEKEW